VVEPSPENRLYRQRGALMQQPTALAQDRTVGDLLRKYVFERVARVVRVGLLVNKVASLELREHPLQLFFGRRRDLVCKARSELFAQDGDGLKQFLLFRRQTIDPRSDN